MTVCIFTQGCVPPLVNLLDKPDVRIVSVALEGIENILKCGQRNLNPDGSNPFVTVVEMCGGVDKIEELQVFCVCVCVYVCLPSFTST